MSRTVVWDGFYNARDLGGLDLIGGGATVPGRVFRSATLSFATGKGWQTAWSAGVRTVLDLRNDDEVDRPVAATLRGSAPFTSDVTVSHPPVEIDTVRVALDDVDDTEMWHQIRSQGLDGTPLYFRMFLERKADRCADAVRAVARARPGGVLFHCGAGRDRTGLVALLLLSLAGVTKEAIVEDYEQSARDLPALFTVLGRTDEGPLIEQTLGMKGLTTRQAVLKALDGLDTCAVLRGGGLSDDDAASVRDRLLA